MARNGTLLGLLFVGLVACSEPNSNQGNSDDGSVQLPPQREIAEMFDLAEEGAPEIVAYLEWSYGGGPDTGQTQALRDLPPEAVYARLDAAFEGAINDFERAALLSVAFEVIALEMLPFFVNVLERPIPPELFEIDPHNGLLMMQLGIYSRAVMGLSLLYEGGIADARPHLLSAASHPLAGVRRSTATLVGQGTDEALIEEVRALLPEEDKGWL